MKYIKKFEELQDDFEEYVEIDYHNIDIILESYFSCALELESDEEEFEDKTTYDITDESRKQAKEQIEWFVNTAGSALNDIQDDSIGYDLWLTRNGHGAGFWDRGYDEDVTSILMFLCENLGESYIEIDNNDKVRIYSHSNKYKTVDIEKYKKDRKLHKDIKKYNI